MRKLPLVLLVLLIGSHTVLAQPGADADAPYPPPPPPAPQPYPQPMPPPQPYGQPPPGYQPGGYAPVQLTPHEHELLQKGEITDGQHIAGAAASIFVGFGIGQAVQGRYGETGWIFTVGEIASITALFVGVAQAFDGCGFEDSGTCDNGGEELIIGGLIGLFAFRIWEVVDAFGGPPKHNRKVRELKMRLGIPQPMYTHRIVPFVNRTRDSGATAGIRFHF